MLNTFINVFQTNFYLIILVFQILSKKSQSLLIFRVLNYLLVNNGLGLGIGLQNYSHITSYKYRKLQQP